MDHLKFISSEQKEESIRSKRVKIESATSLLHVHAPCSQVHVHVSWLDWPYCCGTIDNVSYIEQRFATSLLHVQVHVGWLGWSNCCGIVDNVSYIEQGFCLLVDY